MVLMVMFVLMVTLQVEFTGLFVTDEQVSQVPVPPAPLLFPRRRRSIWEGFC
jgi:hypothetical protein